MPLSGSLPWSGTTAQVSLHLFSASGSTDPGATYSPLRSAPWRFFSTPLSLLTYYLSRASWAAEDYITYLTQIDPLTGILNRRGIEAALNSLSLTTAGTSYTTAILLCDIDDFKKVNDSHGHDLGDKVLTQAVAKMKNALRASDRLGRWGGEEFLVLLPGTELEGARIAGAKLLDAVSTIDPEDELPNGSVTMTIGATVLRPGEGVAAGINRADIALYRGKQSGKNRVVAEG